MSQKNAPTLHIEWAPGQVKALNVATNQSATGVSLAELRSVVSGHKEVLVGVGRSAVFLRTVRLPKAAPEDLRSLLGVRVGQLFPLPADQLSFDFVQTNDQTPEGNLTVVAAIRSSDLIQLRSDLQQAGLKPTRILPVALGATAVASRSQSADALVVEQTKNGINLDVVQGGVLRFSRVARADSELSLEAQRTQAAAGVGELTQLVASSPAQTALSLLHEAPPFAFTLTADRAKELQQRVATRTRFALLLTASAILLATLLAVNRSDAQAEVDRTKGKLTLELTKFRKIRDTKTTEANAATTIQSTLKTAFETAQPLSDITAIVGDSQPSGAWLSGLSLERGKPVQLRGTATNGDGVAKLVEALGASKRFRDVKLVFANTAKIDDTSVVQFSVSAVAVGNLPVPSPVKATKKSSKTPSSGKTP